jgi:hypothetical protein
MFPDPTDSALGFMRSLDQVKRAIQWEEVLSNVPNNHALQQSGAQLPPSARC